MVETAPLPANFDVKPLDADKLPTAAPVETTATVPNPAFEQPVRRILPGGGHVTATKTALETLAQEMERERAWGNTAGGERVIKHAADIAREQREREEAAEARRRASDLVAVLKAAHSLRSEAQAEVDRLGPLVIRARELVAEIEGRAQAQEAAAKAARTAAAERLIEALAAGTDRPDETSLDTAEAEATAPELATAKAALAKLETELTAARDLLVRRGHGVSRCAVAVLTDQAADLANDIIAADRELRQRRADLGNLAQLLTGEGRRLNSAAPSLPPQISKALYPPDPVLTGADRGLAAIDWWAAYHALIEAPCENEIGPASDSAAAEAP